MLEIYNKLEQWRNDRHLTIEKQAENLLGNILEECTEYIRAKDTHEKIDAICDISVFTINSMPSGLIDKYLYAKINQSFVEFRSANKPATTPNYKEIDKSFIGRIAESATMDKYLDILYYCHRQAFTLGYSYVDCMSETIKEISSRVGAWDESIGKFVKDLGFYTLEEAQLTYPNYVVTQETDRFKVDMGDEIQYKPLWYKADYSKCKLKDEL